MGRRLYFFGSIFFIVSIFLPLSSATAQRVTCVNSYKKYVVKTYTLPPNTLNPGPNQHDSLRTNAAAARADIGKTFFTTELTHFNDRMCAGGPCPNNVPGIAHRTWPLKSCVAVCNSQNKKCAIAIVMDRGPNTRLRCRTIDANPALRRAIAMKGGTVPATYQLLSLPPKTCEGISPNISADAPHITSQSGGVPSPSGDYSQSLYSSSPYTLGSAQYPSLMSPPPAPSVGSGASYPFQSYVPGVTAQPVSTAQSMPTAQTVPSDDSRITLPSTAADVSSEAKTPSAVSRVELPRTAARALSEAKAPIRFSALSFGNIVVRSPDSQLSRTKAAGSISVIPSKIVRGERGAVTWRSAGMAPGSCRVTTIANGKEALVGRGERGTRSIRISANSKTGTLTFTLSCTTLDEDDFERSARLVVQ